MNNYRQTQYPIAEDTVVLILFIAFAGVIGEVIFHLLPYCVVYLVDKLFWVTCKLHVPYNWITWILAMSFLFWVVFYNPPRYEVKA